LLQAGELLLVHAGFSERCLDRLELLAQQELALVIVEMFLGPLADFLGQAQHLNPMGKQLEQRLDPLGGIHHLQQRLLFVGFGIDHACRDVSQGRGLPRRLQRMDQLRRHAWQQRQELGCAFPQLKRERLRFGRWCGGLFDGFDPCGEEGVTLGRRDDAKALQSVNDGVNLLIIIAQVMSGGGEGAHGAQVLDPRIIIARVLLQHDADGMLALNGVFERRNRLFPAHADGGHDLGKQHEISHRNQRHDVGWGQRR